MTYLDQDFVIDLASAFFMITKQSNDDRTTDEVQLRDIVLSSAFHRPKSQPSLLRFQSLTLFYFIRVKKPAEQREQFSSFAVIPE